MNYLTVLWIIVWALTFSGCGGGASGTNTSTEQANESTPVGTSDRISDTNSTHANAKESEVDTAQPTISLNGSSTISLYVGDIYQDAGATAMDANDGNITANIQVSNRVNTAEVGTYTVTYSVNDNAGNSANPVTRIVTVNVKNLEECTPLKLLGYTLKSCEQNSTNTQELDTTKPLITLNGTQSINISTGDTYQDMGATAMDESDGNITENIVILNNLDTSKAGVYTIHYSVTDSSGNKSDTVTRTITVSDNTDTVNPIITLNGSSTVTIYVGDNYEDSGATAYDNNDQDISSRIITSSNLDTSKVGNYTISYNVSDSADNLAQEVSRHIIVSEKPDTTKPIITLNGSSTITLYVGENYQDPGAIAIDNEDGVITDNLIVNNNIDTTKTGTYSITYNITDSAGNKANTLTRTVIVNEKPCIAVETLNYGVKGDDVTDDTEALNRAFATEENICLSKQYKINGVLTIARNDLTVHGGGTLFRDTTNLKEMLNIQGKNITLRDLEFDGKDKTPHGIEILEHSSDITLDNIYLHHFYSRRGDGATLVLTIAGNHCDNITIKNCTFSNLNGATDGSTGNIQGAVRAIYVNSENRANESTNIVIDNNTFSHIEQIEDGDAIQFQGDRDNLDAPYPNFYGSSITNNHFINCVKRAIKIQANHLSIENNTIHAEEKILTAIELFGDYNVVQNNTIDIEYAISGITVTGNSNSIENNLVTISKINNYTQYNSGFIYGLINMGDSNTFNNNIVTTWSFGYMEKKYIEHGKLKNPIIENSVLDANRFYNCKLNFADSDGLRLTNGEIIGQGKEVQDYGIYYSSPGHTNFNNAEIIENNIIKNVGRGIILKNSNSEVMNIVKEANNFDVEGEEVNSW